MTLDPARIHIPQHVPKLGIGLGILKLQGSATSTCSRFSAGAKEGGCNPATIMLRFAADRESRGWSLRKRQVKSQGLSVRPTRKPVS
jgi:hypothetical protein